MSSMQDRMMLMACDIAIELRADGTYRIIKDRNKSEEGPNFEPHDEVIYGVRKNSTEVCIQSLHSTRRAGGWQ